MYNFNLNSQQFHHFLISRHLYSKWFRPLIIMEAAAMRALHHITKEQIHHQIHLPKMILTHIMIIMNMEIILIFWWLSESDGYEWIISSIQFIKSNQYKKKFLLCWFFTICNMTAVSPLISTYNQLIISIL